MTQTKKIDLDRCVFTLEPRAHEEFLALLEAPEKPSEELRARMNRAPSWERGENKMDCPDKPGNDEE
jgi:uncharacterized protein (DUF1778 family)